MALAFTRELDASAIVYDCMDELSAFHGAPPELLRLEAELFERADLVFTGGRSLYEAKRDRHQSVYHFPSSVDAAHFRRARGTVPAVVDQARIPRPRLGFYGVIDERMDLDLLRGLAAARPDWHIVLIGPVTKIDENSLPRGANLHYLGPRPYDDLPAYLAGWDVALLPFARNESTRFISPTKTPEYLAAGKPVVSTSIQDVVQPYGEAGLVRIADTVDATVAAVLAAMAEDTESRLARSDAMLARMSWDRTWMAMDSLLVEAAPDLDEEAAGV
jgi:UDP-galactopyranose mutase